MLGKENVENGWDEMSFRVLPNPNPCGIPRNSFPRDHFAGTKQDGVKGSIKIFNEWCGLSRSVWGRGVEGVPVPTVQAVPPWAGDTGIVHVFHQFHRKPVESDSQPPEGDVVTKAVSAVSLPVTKGQLCPEVAQPAPIKHLQHFDPLGFLPLLSTLCFCGAIPGLENAL